MKKAVALVQKCLANQESVLDPGNCGLNDDDLSSIEEVGMLLEKCTHLTTLILSNTQHAWNLDEKIAFDDNYALREADNFSELSHFYDFSVEKENRFTKITSINSSLINVEELTYSNAVANKFSIQL